MKIFSSIMKRLHFHFQLNSNYICMAIIAIEFFQKSLQFYTLSYVILKFIIHMLDENLDYFTKMSPFPFQLHSNCIYMVINVSEFFLNIQFFKIRYVVLILIIHILDENLLCYRIMSPLLF